MKQYKIKVTGYIELEIEAESKEEATYKAIVELKESSNPDFEVCFEGIEEDE